ncbi:MAG: hypothetical protein ACQEWL_05735 [Pseudomonadota bacterium]
MNWKRVALILVGVMVLGGLLNWLITENRQLINENKSLTKELAALELISKVTQSTIILHYQVSLHNIKAKQREDSEYVKVKTVIKTILKDNECANTAVPDDVINGLHNYKRGISARSTSTDPSTSNR